MIGHTNTNNVREIYNQTAKEYEEFVIPCKICQYLILIHELDLNGDEKVLELGSGPGYLSMEIARVLRNGMVTGVDISENMVSIATTRARERGINNIKFIVGNVMDLKFKDKSFDVCVNSYLIHWLPDGKKFLSEIHRVLKTHGKLGIILPSKEWYNEIKMAYHSIMKKYSQYFPTLVPRELVGIKMYSESEIRDLIENCNFRIHKLISFKFKESTPIDLCLKRIDAKSGERYLSFIPKDMREEVKRDLLKELSNISCGLATTESGYIIVAEKD